jgi:hypothetical protein
MPASRSRTLFRLHTGVNRKSCVTRWIGSTTVRVVILNLNREKASEGAERSCRKRRRKRGQRRGKRRSRVGKTRPDPAAPAQSSKEPKGHTITKHLRACDHWYDRQEQFGKLFKESQLYRDGSKSCYFGFGFEHGYRAWEKRWLVLRNRIVVCGEGVIFCSRIGDSFSYWLEQRFGLVWKRDPSGYVSADVHLKQWRANLAIQRAAKKRPRLHQSTKKPFWGDRPSAGRCGKCLRFSKVVLCGECRKRPGR